MPVPADPPVVAPAAFQTWAQDVADTAQDHEARIDVVEAAGYYAPGGTDVAIADGGTGASTAAAARTNLGVPADGDVVHDTGDETIAGVKTFSSDPIIPDEVYGAGWNGSLEPPTKNAVYDKVETLVTIGPTTIQTKTTTYTAVDHDLVLASASGGAWVLTLPAVGAGKWVTVKKTDSSANAITVTPASGTIDGAATYVIDTQWVSRDFVSDGSSWYVV